MDAELRDRACDLAYRDHAPEVYRVAYSILRDSDDALDATHDAFARAWERWEQYDTQRPLRPWLHGIVIHAALDRLRRRRVRQLVAAGPVRDTTAGIVQSPDVAGDVVNRRVVQQAMAELRPEARAALVLRHYYGYEYSQIGEFLGVASGTVGAILSRAHAVLRQRLGAEFAAPDQDDRHASLKASNPRAVEGSAAPPEVLP